MGNHSSSTYWNERFRLYGESRGTYKAICSYGMPYLYNKYIDIVQKKAFKTALNTLPLEGKRVLDFGCGTGRWCRILAAKGADVTGVDISEQAIALAQRTTESNRVRYLVSAIADLELPPHSFDIICCVTVLQHVTDPVELQRSLAVIKRLLKHDGTLVIMEVAPTVTARRHSTGVLSVRTEAMYLEQLTGIGLVLEMVLSTDVVALVQKRLIPLSAHLRQRLFRALVNTAVLIALPVDFLFAGSRFLRSCSWHKVFVFSNNQEAHNREGRP